MSGMVQFIRYKLLEDRMKAIKYAQVEATHYNNEKAKGVAARVVIGKADGADNFCMRVFEISAGGNTPRHTHDWEHDIDSSRQR